MRRKSPRAVTAATALRTWKVEYGHVDVSGSATARSHGLATLTHISAHLLGLPARQTSAVEQLVAELNLPSTGIFARPSSALFVVADGLTSVLGDPVTSVEVDADFMAAVGRQAALRDGLAASSFDITMSPISSSAPQMTWNQKIGFIANSVSAAARTSLSGKLACSPEGANVLARVGLSATKVNDQCPVYAFISGDAAAAAGAAVDVRLDANDPSMCRALSEAAALLVVSDTMAQLQSKEVAEAETGLRLLRVYVAGAAEVAATFGKGSDEHAAASHVLRAAIRSADATLAAAEVANGGRYVSVALSSAPASGRRLPGVPEGGADNEATPSPSASPVQRANTGSAYTTSDVGDYQVALWTAVLLVLTTLGVIYVMLSLPGSKDPQLYAQVAGDPKAKTTAAR